MGVPWGATSNPQISYGALLWVALPSILLQSAAPIAVTVQTALLGHKATDLLAAWAVVATATNAATVVFNFLVVGVTAKVSKVVGARAWGQVGARIRLALGSAVVMGVIAALFLWVLQAPIFILLEAAPEVIKPAKQYFALRVLGVPPQLLAMCTAGILQGYKRVYLVAWIQVLRVALDVAGSYISLFVCDYGIKGVGVGNLLASSCSALLSLVCIFALPPRAGRSKIQIFPSFRSILLSLSSSGEPSGKLQHVLKPLLAGDEQGLRRRESTINSNKNVPKKSDVNLGNDDTVIMLEEVPKVPHFDSQLHWQLSDEEDDDVEEKSLPVAAEQSLVTRATIADTRRAWETWVYDEGADAAVDGEEEEVEVEGVKEGMLKFVWDGLSTIVRSALVQASFFMVLAAVTRLGTQAVAAHQVVMQLWMVNIYFSDGFATAGTIVGSELAGQLERAETKEAQEGPLADLRTMSWRLLYMGAATGVIIGIIYWLLEEHIMDVFTSDSGTKAELRLVWLFLVLIQPLNSMVFVYDGLIYAAQAFAYMATCLVVGFILFFIPTIALSYYVVHTLLSAWFAKAVLNVVRLVVAAYKIHYEFLEPRQAAALRLADL